MGIRDTLNEKPGLTTAVTAAVVFLALGYIVYAVWPRRAPPDLRARQAFFTTDLGQTYAAGPAGALYALDDAGLAGNVRAWVFRWPGGGEPFVAFLERVSPEVAKEHATSSPSADPMRAMREQENPRGHLVAPPGQDQWVDKASPRGREISALPQRDGRYAVPVEPE